MDEDPWRDAWHPDQVPLFVELIREYPILYEGMAGSGVCHCGADMEGHPVWDNHSPVEMMYF